VDLEALWMVEVEIDSIRVSLMSQQRIVILKERNSERFLPIWIGPYEAEAITLSLQEVEVTRPLTHDLLRNVLQELGAEIVQVNITSLSDDVFYALIILNINDRELSIDSRPSDAIALAVRAHVPVFIAEEVMDEASSTPEQNIDGEEIEGEPDERLDVFKDFVETLNLDDLETSEDDDKE
jgi:hypothetical protein